MKKIILIPVLIFLIGTVNAQTADSLMLSKIFKAALTNKKGYSFLHDLCKGAGKRVSGSPLAEKAVQISYDYLKTIADTVYLQDVMVPHWVRGEAETANFTSNKIKKDVKVCALGGSIGTGVNGLKGKVIEVNGIDAIKKLTKADVAGKIVFYNRHFEDGVIVTFDGYEKVIGQRQNGAMEAGKLGAIAVIVRSLTPAIDENPHAGNMRYADSIQKIPAIAIATVDADLLSEQLKKDGNTEFYFRTTCQTLADAPSHNVIAELRGSKYPNEYIIVGGHLDAWDMAEGAHDDGAGVTHASEVIRIMKECGYKPEHTIRVVFFMNEENGNKGAIKYAEWVKTTKQKHIVALESDAGGFTPRGFSFDTNDKAFAFIQTWRPLLDEFGCGELIRGETGVDVSRLEKNCEVLAELNPDSQRYFDFHHAQTDVFEAVNARELEMGAAACTAIIYMFDKHW